MVLASAVLICICVELLAKPLVTLFLGTDGTAAAYATGEGYLTFMGWFFCLIGFKMAVDGLLRGAGDMKCSPSPIMVNLSIRVIFDSYHAPRFGIQMVWCAVPIGWFS